MSCRCINRWCNACRVIKTIAMRNVTLNQNEILTCLCILSTPKRFKSYVFADCFVIGYNHQ